VFGTDHVSQKLPLLSGQATYTWWAYNGNLGYGCEWHPFDAWTPKLIAELCSKHGHKDLHAEIAGIVTLVGQWRKGLGVTP
jgi:hypothetical protein